MRVPSLVFGLALLLLLAGCVGPFADDGPATPTVTEQPTATETPLLETPTQSSTPTDETATATDSATATPTGDPDLSADNPFGQKVVPVRVNDTVNDGRDTTLLVQRSIEYWNDRIERDTEFNYRFTLAEDPADARVEVRYVEAIESCGREHDERTVGCAPLLERGSTAPDVAVARIEVHGSDSAVIGTVEHELGHILGLGHDDPPLVVMGYQTEEPVKDAMDRAVPWYTNKLGVYVDHDSLDGNREQIDDQVGHALEYYNDGGADGTIPDNVTFTRTDHEASADVVITNDESYPCGGTSDQSRWRLQQYTQIDTDPAPEIYARSIICLDLEETETGWHTGYWLGRSMGLEEGELAEPFQDVQNSRDEWWE